MTEELTEEELATRRAPDWVENKQVTKPETPSLDVPPPEDLPKGAKVVKVRPGLNIIMPEDSTKPVITPPVHGIGTAEPGFCPRCNTEAAGWTPPISDLLYKFQLADAIEKGEQAIDFHKARLQQQGAYVERCSKCGLSFIVRASDAKIKE